MYTRPICSLSFHDEPRWSVALGEAYACLPHTVPPFLWWASGSPRMGLFVFLVLLALFPWPLCLALHRGYRAVKWLVSNRYRRAPVLIMNQEVVWLP